MDGLTTKEVKASLRMMGAKYRVKIFEGIDPFSVEREMNKWLEGIGTAIDIIEFFPVGVAKAVAMGLSSSPEIASPLRVEITTPGSSGAQYCSTCSTTISDTLSTDQRQQERESSVAAVGVLYIEYPESQSESSD
jgi:hypothetical protein